VDEPLRWLLADPRRFKVDELFDFLWLRLLDVPRALAARRYAAAGQVVFEVTDPFPTTTSERYLLRVAPAAGEVAPGAAFALPAECTPTSSDPDLALDAGILASAYLGGVSFATLAAAGRVRELTPGAAGRADAMFLTSTAPFSATEF
jgi:predicted acetyltransferase